MAHFNYKKLRKERKNSNMTLNDLSELIGKSKSLLSKIENGTRNPDLKLIEDLSNAFNLKLEDLIVEDKDMTESEKYELTFKRETLSEIASSLEGAISNIVLKQGYDFDDKKNPLVILGEQVADYHYNKIFSMDKLSELDGVQIYFKGLTEYINKLQKVINE